MKYTKSILFLLLLAASGLAIAQQPDMQAFFAYTQCTSNCVDQLTECHVTLEPTCKQVKDKSACYEECDAAYAACLGECGPPPFNITPNTNTQ